VGRHRWSTVDQSAGQSDLPSITIAGLKPKTKYVARVAIYSDYQSRSHGKSTGIIEFETKNGCVYRNSSYGVGSFDVGCEFSCRCDEQGQVECGPRCDLPLHRSGAYRAGDPLCVEYFVEGDECCVVVTCADGSGSGGLPAGAGSGVVGSAGLPGGAGGIGGGGSPCRGIKCGPNAECKHEVFRGESAETICVCKEGYTGDPDSAAGCALHLPHQGSGGQGGRGHPDFAGLPNGCQVKNETYGVGQEWFDGCDYRCVCSEKIEILCQPRCKVLPEGATERCELRVDPDDSCCKVMHCPDPEAMDGLKNPVAVQLSSPFDGCLFKNKTYAKDERFYDGCEQQCKCVGYGDMVCLSRCPPPVVASALAAPGQNCYTLPDISDPCCNITVCDDPVLDPEENVPKEEAFNDDQNGANDDQDTAASTTNDDGNSGRILFNRDQKGLEAPPKNGMEKIPGTELEGIKVGVFQEFFHEVAGTVYALNQSALLVKDFQYDGGGPDAFFWAGSHTEYPSRAGTILPYPFRGIFFDYEDPAAPVLARSYPWNDGYNDAIVLPLPPDGVKVADLKWLSVWCRAAEANFGHVQFPAFTSEQIAALDAASSFISDVTSIKDEANDDVCEGHAVGELFYKGCDEFCVCVEEDDVTSTKRGENDDVINVKRVMMMCNPIECPSNFGLDVINPRCIEWDSHEDFVPAAPMCCPPPPVCLSDGTCHYKGGTFDNYDSIPANVSGCEQRCYCEDGEVACRQACHPVSATPPRYLQCAPEVAVQVPTADRPCCLTWDCPGLDTLPEHVSEVGVEAVNATTLKVKVKTPKILDGRAGFFEVHYVDGLSGHQDPNQWPSKDIKPQGRLFTVQDDGHSVVLLTDLLPNQEYFLKVTINVRDTEVESGYRTITTDITSGRTLPVPVSSVSVPKIQRIDIGLTVKEIQSTSALITWRLFSTEEKLYIDGVQIRFLKLKSDGSPASEVPGTTPFIHRDTSFFLLEDLDPDTEYKVDVYLIPVPKAKVEMTSESDVTFTTLKPAQDPYEFEVRLNVEEVGTEFVGLSWSGVPNPHQQFVNIYRILYAEENSGEFDSNSAADFESLPSNNNDVFSVFKVAKLDSFKATRIRYLAPDTKYQFWLEAYLTNGKVYTSNVLEVKTKSLNEIASDGAESQSPLVAGNGAAAGNGDGEDDGDHEHGTSSAMGTIVASTVAALAVVSLVIVTALYLKRTTTYKAIISGGPGKSRSELPLSNKDFAKRPKDKRISGATSTGTSAAATNGNSMEMKGVGKHGQIKPSLSLATVTSSVSSVASGNVVNGSGNGNAPIAVNGSNGDVPPPIQPRPPPR